MNAIATAKDKGQVTADQASALTVALAKAQEKASQSLTSATTADQINAIIDQLNQDVAGVQLSLQQDVSANAVNQSAQQVVAAISQDATLADNEKQVQQANVSAQQQAALQQITSATTVTDAQSAETTFDQTVATNHVQGQSIDDRRSQLIEAITTATNQATMAINGDPSLTTAAKADQLNQLSQAKDAALAQLAKATTAADGVNFVNQSLTIIAAIHQPAEKTLSQQHQDLLDLITQLANQAAAKIDQEKSLTNSETASLKGQVTALQNAAVQSANESQNADDLQAGQQALQDGLDQVKFMTQQDVNLHALNQAQLDANQVIANNQTLSDVEKANQNIQVMLLFTQYQQALLVAQNLASLASAVNNGIKAVAGVPQDGATVQQRVGNYIDRLTVEKKKVQSRIDADNTLTTADQLLTANQKLTNDLTSVQYNLAINIASYQLLVAYNGADQAINDDPTLSNQEKAEQAEIVNVRWNTGQQSLVAAKTVDEVDQFTSDTVAAINQVHHGGQPVDERMQSYTAKIQASASQAVAQINQDKSLSPTGQAVIVEAVQNNRDWYLHELQGAKSVVEAETMVQDDLNAMAFGQNATSLVGQGKGEWFARIYNELKATDQSINGYLALSADEKSALLQTMQSLVTTTNSQISQGQTLDQTEQSLQDLMLDLTKLNLHASKTNAVNRLQSVFETTKVDITADRSLSHQEVQDQIRTAQAAYDQASATSR
ncbi:hypothetical protein FEFB_03100 [Fructobacillus sp. EFB-N1]|uniref:DUF1542 domain-containing protein n=1 Tax=Fructobacillus sp. EFB-N1 TaxID=1658766 RepID=UPI00064DE3D7|nr:DUF1542 domain-containing protein [Fructobacillus sp. EFB-N1]KMK53866.1 hypothetical protein FEFB_03100 [Fructobacillus sp. EFB-N1]